RDRHWRDRAAHSDNRLDRNLGSFERRCPGPAGPRRDCRVRGKCLFFGQDEIERGSRRDECPGGNCRGLHSREFRSVDQRRGYRSLPGAMGSHPAAREPGCCMIYLDYQATTPVAPEVAKAMAPWIEDRFANPHSPSRWGHEAEAAIEVARKQLEKAIG